MISNRKIKNFSEFVPRFRRILNQLFIVGKTKGGFLKKQTDFEVQIYYTPLKGKIIELKLDGITSDKIPFKIGDNISIAREWCENNGHQITFDKKKL